MKILVTGSNGLLGNAIHLELNKSNHKYLNTSHTIGGLAKKVLDVTSMDSVESVVSSYQPDAIINTAAMANVDKCEKDRGTCWDVNVNGVRNLSEVCDRYNIHLIHISTDYIFDGLKDDGIYFEDDKPSPLSIYGESKLASEKVIISSGIRSAILRTILVYGNHERKNIVTFIKEKLEMGEEVDLVSDQVRMPTFVDDFAKACISAVEKKAEGIYHVCGDKKMSYYDLGIAISNYFSLNSNLINHVQTKDLNQIALRPPNTGFDLKKSVSELDFAPTKLQDSLKKIFN